MAYVDLFLGKLEHLHFLGYVRSVFIENKDVYIIEKMKYVD